MKDDIDIFVDCAQMQHVQRVLADLGVLQMTDMPGDQQEYVCRALGLEIAVGTHSFVDDLGIEFSKYPVWVSIVPAISVCNDAITMGYVRNFASYLASTISCWLVARTIVVERLASVVDSYDGPPHE